MKLDSRLHKDIASMSKIEAGLAINSLKEHYANRTGRIVFKFDGQKVIGASRDSGFWSGIKAVFSKSYRERRSATESAFGELCAKAAGQNIDSGLVINGLRQHRRNQAAERLALPLQAMHGVEINVGVEGQLTPGLMNEFEVPSNASDIERFEHALTWNYGLSRDKIDHIKEAVGRSGLTYDRALYLYQEVGAHEKQVSKLRNTSPEGSAWLDKTPRQCTQELVDSLSKETVDLGDVLIQLSDLHARVNGFVSSNRNNNNAAGGLLTSGAINTDILNEHINDALGKLTDEKKRQLHKNIQSNSELCALVLKQGVAGTINGWNDLETTLKDHETLWSGQSCSQMMNGKVADLGAIMLRLNREVCAALDEDNQYPEEASEGDKIFQVEGKMSDPTNIKGGEIMTTLYVAQLNGGDMRKAVQAYQSGIRTEKEINATFDEAATWPQTPNLGKANFYLNFGFHCDAESLTPDERFLFECGLNNISS